jgi:hypothetical protein
MRPDHAYDPSERAGEAAPRRDGAAATPPEPWDHDRQCRVAWCRVHGDRQPRVLVARELGVTEVTLGVMLARGEKLSTSALEQKPKPKVVEEETQDERIKRFRELMRAARARVAT